MDVALSLKDIGLILIGIGILVLIFYLISVFKNLAVTLKSLNKVLTDVETISGVAAERTKDVDKVIEDVASTVGMYADNIKGNQSTVSALTSIVNTIISIKNLFVKSKKENAE